VPEYIRKKFTPLFALIEHPIKAIIDDSGHSILKIAVLT